MYLTRSCNLKEIEKDVKNKFRWQWLEAKDCNGDFLSDYVRKLPKPGFAFCIWCDSNLDYRHKENVLSQGMPKVIHIKSLDTQ